MCIYNVVLCIFNEIKKINLSFVVGYFILKKEITGYLFTKILLVIPNRSRIKYIILLLFQLIKRT